MNNKLQIDYEQIITFVHNYLKKRCGNLYFNPNHREDLVAQCMYEIVQQIDKYNPLLGSLSTFLVPAIKCGIKNYYCFLLNKKENSLKNYFQIKKAQEYLLSIGEEITISNISQITGFSEGKIYNELTLPDPTELVYDETIFENLTSYCDNPESIACEQESIIEAMEIISNLSKKDQQIIKDYIEYLSSDKGKFTGDKIQLAKAQARARFIRDNKFDPH